MILTPNSEGTAVTISDSAIIDNLINDDLITSAELTVTTTGGVTYNFTILSTNTNLIAGASNTFVLNSSDLGLEVDSVFPDEFYSFTLVTETVTGDRPTTTGEIITVTIEGITETSCVIIDCAILCQIHNKVLQNITSETCERLPYHIMYEVINNIQNCDGCNCETGASLYEQLKSEVSSEDITTTDCGCQ